MVCLSTVIFFIVSSDTNSCARSYTLTYIIRLFMVNATTTNLPQCYLTSDNLRKIKQQILFQPNILEQIANKKLVRKTVVNDFYSSLVKAGLCMSKKTIKNW